MLQHFLFQPQCLICRMPLGRSTSFCFRCARFLLEADRQTAFLFPHEGPAKGFLASLRGNAPYTAAAWAFALMERRGKIMEWKEQGVQAVFPAPQRPRGHRMSGLALVAESVSRALQAEFRHPAFRKIANRVQHGKARIPRMDTECFVELAIPEQAIKRKHVLVIDDVSTTGTTLDLCGYVLRKAGAARCSVFSLARQEFPLNP